MTYENANIYWINLSTSINDYVIVTLFLFCTNYSYVMAHVVTTSELPELKLHLP